VTLTCGARLDSGGARLAVHQRQLSKGGVRAAPGGVRVHLDSHTTPSVNNKGVPNFRVGCPWASVPTLLDYKGKKNSQQQNTNIRGSSVSHPRAFILTAPNRAIEVLTVRDHSTCF
jgi:hypothetical protein